MSMPGGAPGRSSTTWSGPIGRRDGQSLAIAREVGVRHRLEYPIGKVLFETDGWIGHLRVSPKGDLVAFIDHPFLRDDGGSIAVVDRNGKKTQLTPVYESPGPRLGRRWPGGLVHAAEEGHNRARTRSDSRRSGSF
jgi:hypothetical protein